MMPRIFLVIAISMVLLISCCVDYVKCSRTNFDIRRFELCNSSQTVIKFKANIVKQNGNQYYNQNLTLSAPLDDKIGFDCLIESKVAGNTFMKLFTIKENNLCKAFNKYLGEFWYDIERQARIPAGLCPIREGNYPGHNIQLNFDKMSLQTFPFGTLRFTLKAVDNKNPRAICLWCLFVEVENAMV